jgi:hypothetical protein
MRANSHKTVEPAPVALLIISTSAASRRFQVSMEPAQDPLDQTARGAYLHRS